MGRLDRGGDGGAGALVGLGFAAGLGLGWPRFEVTLSLALIVDSFL